MSGVGFTLYELRITIYEVFGVVEEFGLGYVLGLFLDLRFTIYEAFGVVEGFGPGYVLGLFLDLRFMNYDLRGLWGS